MTLNEYQACLAAVPHGKRLPTALYLHRQGLASVASELDRLACLLADRYRIGPEFNVLKFRSDELKVSFLSYPRFFEDPHPSLRQADLVNLGYVINVIEDPAERLATFVDAFRHTPSAGRVGVDPGNGGHRKVLVRGQVLLVLGIDGIGEADGWRGGCCQWGRLPSSRVFVRETRCGFRPRAISAANSRCASRRRPRSTG